MLSRRVMLVSGTVAAVAGAAAVPFLRDLLAPGIVYEPLPGVPGFRRMAGGPVSAGSPALIGIGESTAALPDGTTLCDDLFAAGHEPGKVPIAYFSDYRCVYCRELSPLLHDIIATAPVTITWHELPLLGPASTRSARAALAARAQGAYAEFHDRLMGTPFLPNDSYLQRLAANAGIDSDRLLSDMRAPGVTDQIRTSAALARLFGFIGTPALVVGRTAVLGNVGESLLRRLIAAETADPGAAPCPPGA